MKRYSYGSHDEYTRIQVDRHEKTRHRTVNRHDVRVHDIKVLKKIAPDAQSILCVGARHFSEVKDFRDAGYEALGLDLLDAPEEYIVKMDMHDIVDRFGENSYDIVYTCHSLEHSNNAPEMLKRMLQVAKIGVYVVLPVQAKPTEKDPSVFDFMQPRSNASDEDVSAELSKETGVAISVEGVNYRYGTRPLKTPAEQVGGELAFFVRL